MNPVLPKISIITPSFNQGHFIEETILSVINQNYPELEYIVIDGGSKDSTVEVIKKYEKHISYWVSEKDKGQSEAINKGLKRATGEIVAWLNSDDMYTEGTLWEVANFFSSNPDVDILYGNVWECFPSSRERYINKSFDYLKFLTGVNLHQPSIFWRRKLHEDVGYLSESLYYTMDYDLWLRLFYNYRSQKTGKIFSKFRIHDDAKTSNNPRGLYLEYRKSISRFFASSGFESYIPILIKLNVYFDIAPTYKVKHQFTEAEKNQIIEDYIFNCGMQEYTFGNVRSANKIFYYCLKGKYRYKAILYNIRNLLFVRKALNLFKA
ncbi:MAG: glycosyltransferase family 2 protein [Bacteroidetes bacterium]|nr:glycosyltransferase family 2 protein [Bacteroidota bacterium]